ncbi:MAG: transporter substrate-binding domain-containing protein [Desulfotalea sp.]
MSKQLLNGLNSMNRMLSYRTLISRALFLYTLTLFFFLASTSVATIPDRISPNQTLIIGGNKDFAPYEFINSAGVPDGYNIDLTRAIALKEGLNITFSLDTWPNINRDLEDKKIDAVTGMIFSKERDKKYDFSLPYKVMSYALFKRKETPLPSHDDVKNKEIIVAKGVYAHDWLVENQFTDSIITTQNPTEALKLLASGLHDFVFMSLLHGLNLLDDLNIDNVEVAGHPLLVNKISFAVAEGNSALLAELNEGLVSLQQSGEYDAIYQKWFSVSKQNKYISKITKHAGLIISFVSLLLLTILCWNWLLKRAMNRKTLALLQNESRMSQIVDNIPIPTYVVDENRVVTHWNRACEILTNVPATQMVGTKNYHKALYIDQEYSIIDLLLEGVLTNKVQHNDSRIYRKSSLLANAYETEIYFSNLGIDGKWLYGTATLLKDNNGNTNGAIETWQDSTESKQLERQLIQSQKMMAIGTLAGGIAHDVNNILMVVDGNAQLALLEVPHKSKLTGYLQQILSAGTQATKLVQQILTFSRQADIETEPVQVSTIVEETLFLFTTSLPSNIKVEQDIQSNVFVMADETHIHQVVMNLCTNASHAMVSGGILGISLTVIQIDTHQIMPDGDLGPGKFVKLTVSDTGQGIPVEVRSKILDPFFTTKKRGEGTGMGLSVTHGIVKQYGGAIDFVSQIEKGSTFHIYLPAFTDDKSNTTNTV